MRAQYFPNELGEVNVGDIIVGSIDKSKLKVINRTLLYDNVYSYICKYIDGPSTNENVVIMSYFDYKKVTE